MDVKIFLVDDEQKSLEGLSSVLNSFFENISIVGMATNIDSAYRQIPLAKPDLLFLDIEIGKENGFQLLERLDSVDFHVVFLTAHEEFALRAIKFSALDYLIKPAEIEELEAVIQKVRANPKGSASQNQITHMIGNFLTQEKNDHKIALAVAEGYEFIKVSDILYLRADGSYTEFFLEEGRTLVTSKNLKFFEAILDNYGFFRIHKSTIVNLKYIDKVNRAAGGSLVMKDKQEFSISKSRKTEFMNLLSLS